MDIPVLVSDDVYLASSLLDRDYRLIAQIAEADGEYYFFHATDDLLAELPTITDSSRYALDSLRVYI